MMLAWRPRRYHVVAAIWFALIALVAPRLCLPAANGRALVGVDAASTSGTVTANVEFSACQVSELYEPHRFGLSALAISAGDSLLVLWIRNGWAMLRLSADGHTLRTIEADFPPGHLTGAVRLPDGRILVSAEEGIFRFDGHRRLERIADCEQTGPVKILTRPDGSALTASDGSLLLAGERGVLRLSPAGRLERLGSPPFEQVRALAGDAVLVSGTLGHYLLSRDGRTTPIASGARGTSDVVVRGAKQDGGAVINPLAPTSELAVLDATGRATWAKLPADVRVLSGAIELGDGRVLWLSDRGLLRLRDERTMENISPAVRLVCGDPYSGKGEGDWARPLPDGRTLVQAQGHLFTIDRDDRVAAVASPSSCPVGRFPEDKVAVAADGSIYFVLEGVLHRAGPNGGTVAFGRTAQTGTIYSLERHGADLLLSAKEGVFNVRADGSLERLAPAGTAVQLAYADPADPEGRPLLCVNKNALHWLDSQGTLQPMRAAAGIDCRYVRRVGALGLLMERDETSHVLVTRDDRPIPIPYARVWVVTQLADGSAILMAMHGMHAGVDGPRTYLAPTEEAAVARSFIRVSPEGRIEPVAFEGPAIALDRPSDPTWAERIAVRALQFSSPTRGWAIFGKRSVLSMTEDGGAQWRGVISGGEPIAGLAALSFTADGRRGIAVGKQSVWLTEDAGATWKREPAPRDVSDIRQVWLLGPEGSRAYAIADRLGKQRMTTDLLLSSDGGRTWAPQALPLPAMVASQYRSLSAMGFDPMGQHGWLVGADRLLTTSDGGKTWQLFSDLRDYFPFQAGRSHLRPLTPGGAYFAVAYWTPGEHGCIALTRLSCIVAGEILPLQGHQQIETDADVFITALAVAPDGHHGWAVGTQGTILATADGGKKWSPQPSGTRATLWGVFFLADALHGWAWGEEGLLRTRDGGTSWQPAREKRARAVGYVRPRCVF